MSIDQHVISILAKDHPYSIELLEIFAPLIDTQNELAKTLPPMDLPEFDSESFVNGKACVLPADNLAVYCDHVFLEKAPEMLCLTAQTFLPQAGKSNVEKLREFLKTNTAVCLEIIRLCLLKQEGELGNLAKKYKLDESALALIARQSAGAAGRRVALMAGNRDLSAWKHAHCPICGSLPHASAIRKEGQRFLQCSLCFHEWHYLRSACPVCNQNDLKNLPVFYAEGRVHERAEACKVCKHYLLGIDTRSLTSTIPLELYILCLIPLDIMLQEKGYKPVAEASLKKGNS